MHRRYSKNSALLLAVASMLTGLALANDPTASRPSDPADIKKKLIAEVQIRSGYLWQWFTEADDETRILILRVSVTNRQPSSITIDRSSWTLSAETHELPAILMPPELTRLSVTLGGERVALDSVETKTLELSQGEEASTWLVFKNVPDGDQVPEMTLTCNVPNLARVQTDVDQTFANRLKLRSERLGPANSIALLTIDGSLDTINVGTLAREIDLIAAKQVYRVIVNFGPDADVPDRNVSSWLRRVAIQSGRNPIVDDNFPSLPSSLIDFHYVNRQAPPEQIPNDNAQTVLPDPSTDRWNGSSRNIHRHLAAAVDSATAPLCEMVSREELVRSMRHADKLTKAAVLRHGAERLVGSNLPAVLSMTDDEDQGVSNAAVFALRRSSDPTAIKALIRIALSPGASSPEPGPNADTQSASRLKRAVAVQSLAASNYATAHSEVLSLLSTDDKVLRVLTSQAIAATPRPTWSVPLAALFQQADDERRVELLPALAAVGHPRLLTVLAECLASDEPQLGTTALDLLIDRQEPAAEQLASEWMLKHLQSSPPSTPVLSFLRRTRDHRAVPLLLKHLDEKSIDRYGLLMTVLTIGDHRVAEQIAADFAGYDTREQLLILKTLDEVHSNLFWKLIETIIKRPKLSPDKSLEGVVALLQKSGSDRAVGLLIELLSKLSAKESHSQRHFAVVCAALASTGTPAARDALRDVVRNSDSSTSIAKLSLAKLYARSPARNYVSRGDVALKSGNTKMAMQFLDAAVKTDPELPAARVVRGNVALHIKRPSAQELETARIDFTRFVELEPDQSEGHTGLALVLVRQGDVEAGIAAGMKVSKESSTDSVYLYNMACVYGRAIEYLESHPDSVSPEQKSQIEQFRSQGVDLLQQSIDNDLDDDNLAWMQQDPDLETIRRSPAFKALVEKTLGKDKNALDQKVPAKP